MVALTAVDTGVIFRDVDRVILNWNVAEVRVVSHDEPYVEIRWPGAPYGLKFERKGGTLHVRVSLTCDDGDRQLIIFGIPLCNGDIDPGSVEVRIPRTVKTVAMNGKIGDVMVEDFDGDTLNVNVSIANLEMMDSRVAYMKIRSSIGSVEMHDTEADFLDSDIDIGSVEGEDVRVERKKVKFLVGSISLD